MHQETGADPAATMPATGDYGEFFAREQASLVRFCWGLTTVREDARDVAQETMARVRSEWAQISAAGSNPAAWTRTVALNLVRGGWRRSQIAEAGLSRMEAHERNRGSEQSAVPDIDLQRALCALPQRQREAVVLHHLVDLPVSECADLMGIGDSTVKIHLARGRAAMAVALQVDEETGEPVGRDGTEAR